MLTLKPGISPAYIFFLKQSLKCTRNVSLGILSDQSLEDSEGP